MAKKSKKKTAANDSNLPTEREEAVSFSAIAKDERTYKFIGLLLIIFSFIILFALSSYVSSWSTDQDGLIDNGSAYLANNEIRAQNALGRLGALLSHFLIYRTFGVASFLFCSLFFTLGINLLIQKKYFAIAKQLKYLLVGLLIFSVVFAFIFSGAKFPWGGAYGYTVNNWLIGFVGKVGTGLLLFAGAAWYLIWRFNPNFSFSSLQMRKIFSDEGYDDTELSSKEVGIENGLDYEMQQFREEAKNATTHKTIIAEEEEEQRLTIVVPEKKKTNGLKSEKTGVVVIAPDPIATPEKLNLEIKNTPVAAPHVTPKGSFTPEEDLTLEVQTADTIASDISKIEEESNAETAKAGSIDSLYDPTFDLSDYKYPSIDLLEIHGSEKIVQDIGELEANKNQIINTLRHYDIEIQKIMATVGPTVTLYEIVPAPGVRISRIKNLEDDIALSLAALGIRIIAPIPGKGTIGIEVPNLKKTIVSMRTLLASDKFQNSSYSLPIGLGKRIDNENFIVDLATMPHLLMAGATGQGKSVGLNVVLASLLYKKHPSQLKFVLVDPKKVELTLYRHIENHFLAKLPGEEESIITDTKKVVYTLNALCIEMDTRYDLLKEAGCRNIREYNEKFVKRRLNPEKGHQFLPFIVLVIDEFADLIMTAGKEVETPIARLAQLARAIGIHLIIATQRPSVNIITGTIKANFPARIAFKVSSKIDSRTILDAGGAEQLIGKGDMLVSYNGELTRLQCAFVDTPEVDKIVEFISNQRGYPQPFLLPEYLDDKDASGKEFSADEKDALFDDAARLIVSSQSGSTSLIQRKLKLGYNRAGRVMDQLEAAGIVGPAQGSKPRDVFIKTEADLMEHLNMLG
jgi:S-DNA-T family DNA segregation ATPase FtsK/SpoIIIE